MTISRKTQVTGASITLLLLILLGGLLLAGRLHKDEDSQENVSVAATIFPLYDLTRTIAGGQMDVQLMIEPGVSEHSFEASPALTRALANTDAVFFIGAGLDDWVKDSAPDTATLVDLSTSVSLIEVEGDEEFPTGKDPHYWLSPKNAMLMAAVIRDELATLDPASQTVFHQNYDSLVADLERLDEESRASLGVLSFRNIATFHEAFSYFARDFDLNVVATFEPFPGQTPSPEELAEYEGAIATYGLKTIFSEPQLASDALTQVAEDLNVRLVVLDPVGGVEGRDSYRKLIEYNVITIRNVLIHNN
ncbi:MAG: zinc ABC transporter substrate-binding protein [Candidatus Kerfeldbacteria bacterium]|nr:zinc ABC transporter substrate-binding protein [Candidatus Kerfeldbacteria bacterium]